MNPSSTHPSPSSRWRWLKHSALASSQTSLAVWTLSGALTGAAFTLADLLDRLRVVGLHPVGWTWRTHALATAAMYVSLGALVGLGCWVLTRAERGVGVMAVPLGLPIRFFQAAASLAMPLTAAAIAGAWVWTAHFAPPNDAVGWVAFGLALLLTAAFVALAPALLRWRFLQTPRRKLVFAAAGATLGSVCAWLDLSLLVALYPFVHAVGELLAVVLWLSSFHLMLSVVLEHRRPRRFVVVAAGVAAVAFVGLGGTRWAAHALHHTANQKGYAGRLIEHGGQLATALPQVSRRKSNPEISHRSMNRRDERSADACPEAWWPSDAPLAPAKLRAAMPAQPNIAVFYVDTLRFDVASDPRVMPNVARFSRGALNFTRAYATGSDTRSSLPAMIRGNYDMALDDEHNVLRVANEQGLSSAIAIGKSPKAFLAKHVPHFKFDETVEATDADEGLTVWGYGANRSASPCLVSDSVAWLSRPDRKRFFLWQFHYDLHGWKQLESEDLERMARMLGVPRLRSEEQWRYRTIAAGIDAEFGRFLRELDRLGLADETVVFFIADHGEGLGYKGFWLHAVFLWEQMVHVPLMVRVPGLEGRRVDTLVSVIDIAPTLARIMDPSASLTPYQGEDLLTQLDSNRPPRRFPILMRAMVKEQVARLGVVSTDGRRKLVLPVGSNQPELYDLTASVPDDVDIAGDEPATVEKLLPIVMEGAQNPGARRTHERCRRSFSEPDPEKDALGTQNRLTFSHRTGRNSEPVDPT